MPSNLLDLQGFLWDGGDGCCCLILIGRVGHGRVEDLGNVKGTGLGVAVGCCSFSWILGTRAGTSSCCGCGQIGVGGWNSDDGGNTDGTGNVPGAGGGKEGKASGGGLTLRGIGACSNC